MRLFLNIHQFYVRLTRNGCCKKKVNAELPALRKTRIVGCFIITCHMQPLFCVE
jgi:hypothetical protein